MHSVTVIILHAVLMQGLAKEQVQKSADTSVDDFVDKLVDKLTGRLLGSPSTRIHSKSPFLMSSSKYSIANLPGPPALKNRVVQEINAVNRGCRVPTRAISDRQESVVSRNPLIFYSELTEPASMEKVKEMPGITAPTGLFDPIGISTKVPEGQLLFYREAELKHGRVCMLAVLGLIVGERHDFFSIMGNGIPDSLPAFKLATPYINETPVAQFWPYAMALLGAEEFRNTGLANRSPGTAPGDYGFDPLGLKPTKPKEFLEMQNKELNNGRLAMLAAAGIIAQEQVTNDKIFHGIFGIP